MRTGVLHQIPVLHTKFFVTCGRKQNFKKSPLGLQLRETPAVTKMYFIPKIHERKDAFYAQNFIK